MALSLQNAERAETFRGDRGERSPAYGRARKPEMSGIICLISLVLAEFRASCGECFLKEAVSSRLIQFVRDTLDFDGERIDVVQWWEVLPIVGPGLDYVNPVELGPNNCMNNLVSAFSNLAALL
jgi:hypothetical protein